MPTHDGFQPQPPPPGWEQLLEPEGLRRLADVTQQLEHGDDPVAVNRLLRAEGVGPDETAALLSMAGLRRKAAVKFGDRANDLLFTQAALEQSTRADVARTHAQRFLAADCRRVADLGCGIGSESLALIDAGIEARPVEREPFTARLADHNLRVADQSDRRLAAPVIVGDAREFPVSTVDGVFFDPARRSSGHRDTRRLTASSDYSPSLELVFSTAASTPTGVKLGPGFERELIPDDAEAQWVSVAGSLVEMGLWFGPLRRDGIRRSALVIDRHGRSHDMTAAADAADAGVRDLGTFLYEPDGAVIRARLIGVLAERLGAGMVNEHIAYLTADAAIDTPFAQRFRIIEQLPVREKDLSRELRRRDIGRLEIKKRGADIDPALLRKRLRLKGPQQATLILTRDARGHHIALLAERAPAPSMPPPAATDSPA